MIRTILIMFVVFMALALITAWVLSGSSGRIADSASGFSNFFGLPFGDGTSTLRTFELPWQIKMPQGPDIEQTWGSEELRPVEDQVIQIKEEIRELEQELNVQPY